MPFCAGFLLALWLHAASFMHVLHRFCIVLAMWLHRPMHSSRLVMDAAKRWLMRRRILTSLQVKLGYVWLAFSAGFIAATGRYPVTQVSVNTSLESEVIARKSNPNGLVMLNGKNCPEIVGIATICEYSRLLYLIAEKEQGRRSRLLFGRAG